MLHGLMIMYDTTLLINHIFDATNRVGDIHFSLNVFQNSLATSFICEKKKKWFGKHIIK